MSPNEKTSLSVLILDDGEADRELYKRLLRKTPDIDFQITEAATVAEATQILVNARAFDCYVVDYLLPDADGMVFAREVLARTDGIIAPAIVMVTGQGSEEIAVEALKLGVSDYLTKKSISDGFLVQPLKNAIEKSRLRTELRHYRSELERAYKDMSDFAHSASHDLKAPLRRISSYCEILRDDASERLNDEDKAMLDRMITNAGRMQRLIEGLLAYSKITTENEKRELVDMAQMTHEVIEEIFGEDDGSDVEIDIGSLPHVHAFPLKIHQVLLNLVSNAHKYRDPARKLKITIAATREPEHVLFSVTDNGIGIAPEYQEEIFKDFKRLHTQETIEGTGLGLTICRKIIEMHGGIIWVESEPNQGSCFYFTIPHRKVVDAPPANDVA